VRAEDGECEESALHAWNKIPVLYDLSQEEGNLLAGTVTDEGAPVVSSRTTAASDACKQDMSHPRCLPRHRTLTVNTKVCASDPPMTE
jgi:hypothetical protein